MFIMADDGSQNMFLYEPTFNTIKQVKNNVPAWKSKRRYNFGFKPLHGLVPVIIFGRKIVLRFNNGIWTVTQNNNYKTKIINVYIVCELDTWPRVLLLNLALKNCLFALHYNYDNSYFFDY